MEANLFYPLMRTSPFFSPTRVVVGLNSLPKLKDELRPFDFPSPQCTRMPSRDDLVELSEDMVSKY